jgi:DNA primase small subunit
VPDEPLRPQDTWLTERYAAYYRKNPIPLPDRFGRREFGFLFHGQKFFLRHVGFPTAREVQEFMVRNGPAHSYYSTAFYQTPSARTMAEKGWMGAELIFDLDADHVPGAEKLPYRQQLEKVKFHFLRLVEEFVIRDFGFREQDLLLTFSGGRGYHCHVLHEKALQLSAQERREIVDYITGTGLVVENFLHETTVGSKGRGQFERAVTGLRVSPANSPGWGGRLNAAIVQYIGELRQLTPEQLIEKLKATEGVGEKRLLEFEKELARMQTSRIEEGYLDQGSVVRKILPRLLADTLVPIAKGETDEPVTADTKRLIRLPGSLHGKSSLKVVTLRLDEIRDFDPLTEAVAFSMEPVKIKNEKPAKVDVAGVQLDLAPGEHTVPEAAAVMLVARGAALPV